MTSQDVPQATVVPWKGVTDSLGRRAWTIGQLRAAIADLPDKAPFVIHVEVDDDGEYDEYEDQIVVGAGYGEVDWEDGYGAEADPLFGLVSTRPLDPALLIQPDRPRRDGGG
ncbi:hypothetical protein GCM10010149_49670 [Nonomuraea roseoviolacea subsp. roseoviolacea]|uniref:Uncharacterized protein n=1 Tax=Nonomuraea roseoviolacea subsp. carminata TaxID=160689 RepID=A0ABT1KHF5_9ACTN|nr:DUF6225 family protein [Nonomuraea roseoviolacea]MCP2352791.1 hypothetical protein [Nonomuraea roseoviolacea subsp. carminata]